MSLNCVALEQNIQKLPSFCNTLRILAPAYTALYLHHTTYTAAAVLCTAFTTTALIALNTITDRKDDRR